MSEWYYQKEQSAGKFRLQFLWIVYKILGLNGLRIILIPIVFFISLFAKNAKIASRKYKKVLNEYQTLKKHKLSNFNSFQHILNYAYSLADKMSVFCDKKTSIQYEIDKNSDWGDFQKNLKKKTGIFLISSHLGNVEVFSGYSKKSKEKYPLHALMETTQNSIFHQFLKAHIKNSPFTLYSTEEMNFDKIMQLYENVKKGDILLMAGDRISAENPHHTISGRLLNKECLFPLGTFKFVQKIKVPTYSIFVVKKRKNTYLIQLKKINEKLSPKEICEQFIASLEKEILEYPEQWYNFYSYFS